VLNRNGLLEKEQIIADYVMVSKNLDLLEKKNSRWRRTRSTINDMLLKDNILSCKALDAYYEPLLENYDADTVFLENLISSYNPLECERSPIISSASEKLYELVPGPESAHSLAVRFIAGNDLDRASYYLHEALKGENLDSNTRAQWLYELAVVSNGQENYCQAIEHARESLKLKSDFGQAYLLLGDAIILSRKSLDSDFQKRTAYWVAADMYEAALRADPALSAEARKKLDRCITQFPDREDIFFSDISEGQAYRVEGCINDTTTVRARK
jgi:tetratricopeptide (TPR) repeat protein